MGKTQKKKGANETLVNFILDKSGSMESVKEATISSFNEYLRTLKNDGNKYSFSLVLFDTKLDKVSVNQPIGGMTGLSSGNYLPGGNTALYDAVCSTIDGIKNTLKKGQKVLTVIMTDGQENASVEHKGSDVKDRIAALENTGNWSFVFLGANQDSWLNAGAMGISKMNTANFNASDVGIKATMRSVASNTSSFSASSLGNTSTFFSAKDQTDLMNAGESGTSNSPSSDAKISAHFSTLGKKSWEKRKGDLLN